MNQTRTVLVTGACGNVGAHTVDALLERGYRVRALDLDSEAARDKAKAWGSRAEMFLGDICDEVLIARAVEGVDHILHLAAVIPPVTDANQWLGYRVNVLGTRTLLEAARRQRNAPRFTYTSTAAVFGNNATATAPRRADEVPSPSDNYGRQKLECEEMLRASGHPFVVFRLAMTPPLDLAAISPFVFTIHADTKVEFTHPKDLALGLVNSLLSDEVLNGVFMLGGGPENRYRYREWLNMAFESIGLDPVPEEAFGEELFLTDWLDSETSQSLLDYQRRSYPEYLAEIRQQLGPAAHIMPLVRPIANRFVQANSAALAKSRGKKSPLVEAARLGGIARHGLRAASALLPTAGRTGGASTLDRLRAEMDLPRIEDAVPTEFRAAHGLGTPGQYGVAVRDVAEACALAESLGAAPFLRGKVPAPHWTEFGEPGRPTLDVAIGDIDGVQVEFLGPGRGTSFYSDALGDRDWVLHHAGFFQRVDEANRELRGSGHVVAVSGGVAMWPVHFVFRYYDTRAALGCYVELLDFRTPIGGTLSIAPLIKSYGRLARVRGA